jgi:hypothetical protein
MEPGHHQVFNTTILETGFYLQLQEHQNQQNARMYYGDIEALYRYVYNRTIDELANANILDRYMRLRMEPSAICGALQDYFKLENRNETSIAEVLYDAIITHGAIIFSDWTKLYPSSMTSMPFYDIEKELQSDTPWMMYRRKSNKPSNINIQMDWLAKDALGSTIYYDTETAYYIFETDFKNQFDNDVTLIISSNSNRMNQILGNLASAINTAAEIKVVVGKTKQLAADHKLLCTFVIDPKIKRGSEIA